MGMIMVIGIVAKKWHSSLDAEHRFRELGFSRRSYDPGRPPPLRPIAMTALATIAGMLPLAFVSVPVPPCSSLLPSVVGGILSSMVLSLIFTPAIHYYLRPTTVAQE